MKKVFLIAILLTVFVGCSNTPAETECPQVEPEVVQVSFDTMSSASGSYFYEQNSLMTPEEYVPFINERLGAVVVTTINEDQSPNVVVVRPGVSEDGKYLIFGLAENRTAENIVNQGHVAFVTYQYDKTGGEEGKSLNIGVRLIAQYVGDEENARLAEELGRDPANTFFCEIVEVLPLG